MRLKFAPLTISLMACTIVFARGADAPKVAKIDFVRVIQPILESSCVKCHGADRWHGDLRMDTKELALGSFGDLGKFLTPGKPDKSTLYTTSVLPDEDPNAMPLRDRDKLTKEQIEQLRLWIEQGADWPEDVTLKRIDKVFFSRVASVFQTSCLGCHSKSRAEGDLRLDYRKLALKGGRNGAAIVPYEPDASRIYNTLISPSVHDKKPPRLLFDEDIQAIREWIRQGAIWPDDMEFVGSDSAAAPSTAATPKK